MGVGRVVAVAFFRLLFFAALSTSVALLEVGVAAATNTTHLGRARATLLLTAGVLLLGIPSALSYSPFGLAVAGTPVLDGVDESVGTYALPVSAVLIALVFVRGVDLDPVREALGRLYPVVRYVVPPVLVVVTGAKAACAVRPAWRLLLDGSDGGTLAALTALLVLIVLVAVGWGLRSWLPYPRRR